MILTREFVTRTYPQHYLNHELALRWSHAVRSNNKLVIVMDDDPTGIQTVYDVPVYWDWSQEWVDDAFRSSAGLVFFQTNSRAMVPLQARRTAQELMRRIVHASKATERDFVIMSRSDSTLRGHYPLETAALHEVYTRETGRSWDGEILIPFFLEGGRITLDDVHYIHDGDRYLPAGETEFAADATFAYMSSDLKEYIEEKHQGTCPASQVASIPLAWMRSHDVDSIVGLLCSIRDFHKVIVNAVSMDDLKVFTVALHMAEKTGKSFLFRTAASFVKCYGGILDRPFLQHEEIVQDAEVPGIVIVGSHTQKTTRQLYKLLQLEFVKPVEIDSACLAEANRQSEIDRVVHLTEQIWKDGLVPVLFTSRALLTADIQGSERNLQLAAAISDGVVEIFRSFQSVPSFIIAKGGITSSDLGSKGLGIRKATVMGQVRSGIPVIRSGADSRWPNLPYVIFPGNVGAEDDLQQITRQLYAPKQ